MTKYLELFVRESWAIEGKNFLELPKDGQHAVLEAHKAFITADLNVATLVAFVKACEPEARLRNEAGMDVRVAGHRPMPGGENVVYALGRVIDRINSDRTPSRSKSFDYYWQYLWLHPFTDCNGRSARALWLKIGGTPGDGRGFLEEYHYQSLMYQDAVRPQFGHVEYMKPLEQREP